MVEALSLYARCAVDTTTGRWLWDVLCIFKCQCVACPSVKPTGVDAPVDWDRRRGTIGKRTTGLYDSSSRTTALHLPTRLHGTLLPPTCPTPHPHCPAGPCHITTLQFTPTTLPCSPHAHTFPHLRTCLLPHTPHARRTTATCFPQLPHT